MDARPSSTVTMVTIRYRNTGAIGPSPCGSRHTAGDDVNPAGHADTAHHPTVHRSQIRQQDTRLP
ncbi:Uncharacterized protein DAT39_016601, partial [Clarias magur]